MTASGEPADADDTDGADSGDTLAAAARTALLALRDALDRLDRLVKSGKDRYEAEETARLAVQRLWIAAGECARRYGVAASIDAGAEPWSTLWGYRNFLAHRLPSEVGDNRVWAETLTDLPGYRTAVNKALEARDEEDDTRA